jgi:hypothetical protein
MEKTWGPPFKYTGPNLGDAEKEYCVSTPPLHDAESGGFGVLQFCLRK